jgi:hypothetical protein
MFNLSYWMPSEIKGTIKVNKPIRGLGNIIDINGETWNIGAIIGNVVCAAPLGTMHRYYTDTSSFNNYGLVSQKWEPYNLEVIKE